MYNFINETEKPSNHVTLDQNMETKSVGTLRLKYILSTWHTKIPESSLCQSFCGLCGGICLQPNRLDPNPIPIFGYLDDLVLIPFGVILARKNDSACSTKRMSRTGTSGNEAGKTCQLGGGCDHHYHLDITGYISDPSFRKIYRRVNFL